MSKKRDIAELRKRIDCVESLALTQGRQIQCGLTGHLWRFARIFTNRSTRWSSQPGTAIARFSCLSCDLLVNHTIAGLPPEFRKIMDVALKPPQKK